MVIYPGLLLLGVLSLLLLELVAAVEAHARW
jgi:hypothetical protein